MFELIGVAGGEYQLLYRTGNWSLCRDFGWVCRQGLIFLR